MDDAAIGQLMSMGYEHPAVIRALKAANQDVTLATQYLIDGLPAQNKDKNKTESSKSPPSNPTEFESKTNDDPKRSEKISNLMSMGFECDDVLEALNKCNNDAQRAVQYLLDKKQNPNAAMDYLLNKEKQQKKTPKKAKSAYYLYSSTAAHEAVKYRPKKIDNLEQKQDDTPKKKGSEWNTGATMEQFDYSEWMKQRIKHLLLNKVFLKGRNQGDSLKIDEVKSVDGSATFLVIRNKLRSGYDVSFECKWKGHVMLNGEKKEVEGKLFMHDVTSEDDPEDWEYDVTVSENMKEYRMARSIVKSEENRQALVDVLTVWIKEFIAKKQ
eukprot:1099172_1